jgi:hypothetical protein
MEVGMATDEAIKKWLESLFAAFSHEGVLGGKYLGPVMDAEPKVGAAFNDKYYGFRVLTDSFMDFFGETIWKQGEYGNTNGWPQDRRYYVMCLIMYVTMFRSFRASELLALQGGYPLSSYIILRSVKDQAFALAGAANKIANFPTLFGWEGFGGEPWTKEQYGRVIKNRMTIEGKIVRHLIGAQSGLSQASQDELMQWNRMFNFEAHRGLFTMFRASRKVIDSKKFEMVLGPSPDEVLETMYTNICSQVAWMILRLLPYMRRAETPKDAEWDTKWKLLDDSYRMMLDSRAKMGKKIAPAIIELVDKKFVFGPETYYSEKAG